MRCNVDGSPERSIDRANQFVEAGVVFVQEGIDVSSDAMLPILASADIPLVGHTPYGPQQQTDPEANAFFLGSARGAAGLGPLAHFADGGAESVTFFQGDIPTAHALIDNVAMPAADQLGVELRTVFYDVAAPDWNVLAATAMADDPDVVGAPGATEQDCIGFVGALASAGYDGQVFAAGCSAFATELGAQAEGVVTYSDTWRASDPDAPPTAAKRDEIAAYVEAMEASGNEDLLHGYARSYFADTVNLARILATVDSPIDGPAVAEALRSTVDFDSFMGPTISCAGSAWEGENSAWP
ncbi:MAG TPA: hypothetical protein VE623_03410 [Acidimicrobiales bacterium]|nr:hypothetical protein [Acidimicrobiales bacterium]